MKEIDRKTLLPFWVFAVGIVFGFTLPVLIQDAMLYSSVSHNMALGIGTFWFPQYSAINIAGIASFHEQPPLVFGIQALFYKLLGDSIYVERFYTLLTLIIHIILVNKLWKSVFNPIEQQQKLGFIAVFFWILIPVCWWGFHNNPMENIMSIFDLLAVIIIYNCLKNNSMKFWSWSAAGLLIFLAAFSNGLPGLFPIVVPLIYWAVYRKISFAKSFYLTFLLFIIPAFIILILLMFPESNKSLSIYIFERLLTRVNSMPTASYRLEIFWRLFTEFIPVFISLGIIFSVGYYTRTWIIFRENIKALFFFLLVGLSASLPLALTMVQKGWYLVPSFPYLAISAALVISPFCIRLLQKINPTGKRFIYFRTSVIVFFIGVIVVTASQIGRISGEEETLNDVYKIGKVVPKFSTITIPANLYDEYDFILQGFLVRYFNISVDPFKNHCFFLNLTGNVVAIPPGFRKIELGLEKYKLYTRNS